MTTWTFAAPDTLGNGPGWAVWEMTDDGNPPKVILRFVSRRRARQWIGCANRAMRAKP